MNSSTVLIIAVLCLAIGYIAGLVVSSLLGSRAKSEGESESPVLTDSTPAGIASGVSQARFNSDRHGSLFEKVLFWRDLPEGPLQIDFDGEGLSKSGSLTADQRKRLAALLPEIQSWVQNPVSRPKVETTKENSGVISLPEPKKGFVRLELNPKPTVPQPPKSIVNQIDDILQAQIGTTALAGRGIRLTEAPGEGVVVWIGIEHFQGINSVPDAEVLTAIRHAVETWEASA
jgi:hypothetical protein